LPTVLANHDVRTKVNSFLSSGAPLLGRMSTPNTQKLRVTGTYLERGNFAAWDFLLVKDQGGLSLVLV